MYAYWILLALGLLPLIYAHCLDPGDLGMPASRWVMLLAAVTWGLLNWNLMSSAVQNRVRT